MKIIGHRGARGLAPENTIASLQKALEHHVDMIECDVRVTKDDIPVLHHDRELTDPNGHRHPIAIYTYKELRNHKPDLASLNDTLRTIGHGVPLYIDVKPGEPVKPIVKVIQALLDDGWPVKTFYLASKDQETLSKLHAALPKIHTIVIEPWSGVRAHYRAAQLNTKFVSMNQRWLWWGFIRGFKNSDWQLYTYTLNNPNKARRWARWGLAGIVTDYPDRFEPKGS